MHTAVVICQNMNRFTAKIDLIHHWVGPNVGL